MRLAQTNERPVRGVHEADLAIVYAATGKKCVTG